METQWLDALSFDHYGGWQMETQFIREMGQGYLLACGKPGIPVEKASTRVTLQGGTYRLWVRTKNWLPAHSPGRLALWVDDTPLGTEVGCLPCQGWHWQMAGDVSLAQGAHTVSVEDLTGYFSRFSAIVITSDMDLVPSPEQHRWRSMRRDLLGLSDDPIPMGTFDLVVAGGGPGGIPAAIAAARKGMKVALVHDRPVLGGNASSEAGIGLDGAYVRHPGMRETGIAEEIRRLRDATGKNWEDAMEALCQQEANLTVFRNMYLMDAVTEGHRIQRILAVHTIQGTRHTFEGTIYVDATGDGWLGYAAQAPYRIGREAKWQHGEPNAPAQGDNITMSGCLMGKGIGFSTSDKGKPVSFQAPAWAQVLPPKLYREPGTNLATGSWWMELPGTYDDLFEEEAVRDQLFLLSLGYFHWLKNHYHRRRLLKTTDIEGFSWYNAKRENRRLLGDYILTQTDCTSGRTFDDTVAYAGWTIDIHHPEGIYSGEAGPYDFDIQVPILQIPYRCLYSRHIENLMMSGRCISVTHIALGTVRVESTLCTIGQAVGTAAALAIAHGKTPRQVGEDMIWTLQQTLLMDDCYLPGISHRDCGDLALQAKVTASSSATGEHFVQKWGYPGEFCPLAEKTAMVLGRPSGETLHLTLRNSGKETALCARWVKVLDMDTHVPLQEITLKIPEGFIGEVSLPCAKEWAQSIIGLEIDPNPLLSARELEMAGHGMVLKSCRHPHWVGKSLTSYVHRFGENDSAPLADCAPEQVINGVSRALSPEQYQWVSDPGKALPQDLNLTWPQPQQIGEVRLTFDTDLCAPIISAHRLPIVPKLVKDYDLLLDGTVIHEERENRFRHRIHRFSGLAGEQLTVRILSTYGDASARIYEVRVYGQAPTFPTSPQNGST